MVAEHNWFYVPPEHISRSYIVFPKNTAHHIQRVLRKKEDAIVCVTDGQGTRYMARILRIKHSTIKAEIVEKKIVPAPAPPHIDCAFVPLKGQRNEYILEKSKELGVRTLFPFVSKNAVVKRLSDQKMERFKHVMISAMLQSQQCFVSPVVPINDTHALLLRFDQYDRVFVADPDGSRKAPTDGESILLVIGPEGGFERDEVSLFTRAKAQLLSLGVHRLRSETAAITGLVKILTANHIL